MQEYTVVSASSTETLVMLVNEHLKAGWQVAGGLTSDPETDMWQGTFLSGLSDGGTMIRSTDTDDFLLAAGKLWGLLARQEVKDYLASLGFDEADAQQLDGLLQKIYLATLPMKGEPNG